MTAYRTSLEHSATAARDLLACQMAELESMATGLSRIESRRVGRILFGYVGVMGGVAVIAAMAVDARPTLVLAWTWFAAVCAAIVGLIAGERRFSAAVRSEKRAAMAGDPREQVLRLRDSRIAPRLIERVAALDGESYVAPLVAVAMIGPVTVVALVAALLCVPLREIDEALGFCALVTMAPHIYGVCAAFRFPQTERFAGTIVRAGLWSLLPGAFFLGISSLVVMCVAAVLLLIAFAPVRRAVHWERAELEAFRDRAAQAPTAPQTAASAR